MILPICKNANFNNMRDEDSEMHSAVTSQTSETRKLVECVSCDQAVPGSSLHQIKCLVTILSRT